MGEEIVIRDLGITEKDLKKIYKLVKHNDLLIPELFKLKQHIRELEDLIDDNASKIKSNMGNTPAHFTESSLCALYEEMEIQKKL